MITDWCFWMIEMDGFDHFKIFEINCAGKLDVVSMLLQLPLAFVRNSVFFLSSFIFLWSGLCFNCQYMGCWQEIQPHCPEQTAPYLSYHCLFSFGLSVSGIPICFDFLGHIVKDSCFYLLLLCQNDPLKPEQIFQFHSQMGQMEELTSAVTKFPLECC